MGVKAVGNGRLHLMWRLDPRASWDDPGFNQGPTHPVVGVSWNEAMAFCDWLTRKERNEGKLGGNQMYRLPSDGEWSNAVWYGEYPWGTTWPPPKGAGNYADQALVATLPGKNWQCLAQNDDYAQTSPVGSFQPNPYGLYDMGGNVWQWCFDRGPLVPVKSDTAGKEFPGLSDDEVDAGEMKALRGASWSDNAPGFLRSLFRNSEFPSYRYTKIGFRIVLEVGPPRKPSPLLAESNAIKMLIRNHQIEEALGKAQKQTRDYPGDAFAWYDLGHVYMEISRYKEAIPYLTKAVTLDPKMGLAWFDLGNSLAYLGRFDEAIDALTKSIGYSPYFPLSWESVADCYYVKKDLAGGEKKLRELVDAHQNSGYGWCALGQIQVEEGNNALAEQSLQKAVQLQPNYAAAWNSLGLAYGTSQLSKAIDCFRRATVANPVDADAWNNLGYYSFLSSDPDRAIYCYQRALQSKPRHALALYNLVTATASRKLWDIARQACDTLAQIKPDQAAQLRKKYPELGASSASEAKSPSQWPTH